MVKDPRLDTLFGEIFFSDEGQAPEFKIAEILPFTNRHEKIHAFFQTKEGAVFEFWMRNVIKNLRTNARKFGLSGDEAFHYLLNKYANYEKNDVDCNREYFLFYKQAVETLSGINQLLQVEKIPYEYRKFVISELLSNINSCSNGTTTYILEAYDDLLSALDIRFKLQNIRKNICQQLVMNILRQCLHHPGDSVHFVNDVLSKYSSELNIRVLKDTFCEQLNQDQLEEYVENFTFIEVVFSESYPNVLTTLSIVEELQKEIDYPDVFNGVNYKDQAEKIANLERKLRVFGGDKYNLLQADNLLDLEDYENITISWRFKYTLTASIFNRLVSLEQFVVNNFGKFSINNDLVMYYPDHSLKLGMVRRQLTAHTIRYEPLIPYLIEQFYKIPFSLFKDFSKEVDKLGWLQLDILQGLIEFQQSSEFQRLEPTEKSIFEIRNMQLKSSLRLKFSAVIDLHDLTNIFNRIPSCWQEHFYSILDFSEIKMSSDWSHILQFTFMLPDKLKRNFLSQFEFNGLIAVVLLKNLPLRDVKFITEKAMRDCKDDFLSYWNLVFKRCEDDKKQISISLNILSLQFPGYKEELHNIKIYEDIIAFLVSWQIENIDLILAIIFNHYNQSHIIPLTQHFLAYKEVFIRYVNITPQINLFAELQNNEHDLVLLFGITKLSDLPEKLAEIDEDKRYLIIAKMDLDGVIDDINSYELVMEMLSFFPRDEYHLVYDRIIFNSLMTNVVPISSEQFLNLIAVMPVTIHLALIELYAGFSEIQSIPSSPDELREHLATISDDHLKMLLFFHIFARGRPEWLTPVVSYEALVYIPCEYTSLFQQCVGAEYFDQMFPSIKSIIGFWQLMPADGEYRTQFKGLFEAFSLLSKCNSINELCALLKANLLELDEGFIEQPEVIEHLNKLLLPLQFDLGSDIRLFQAMPPLKEALDKLSKIVNDPASSLSDFFTHGLLLQST